MRTGVTWSRQVGAIAALLLLCTPLAVAAAAPTPPLVPVAGDIGITLNVSQISGTLYYLNVYVQGAHGDPLAAGVTTSITLPASTTSAKVVSQDRATGLSCSGTTFDCAIPKLGRYEGQPFSYMRSRSTWLPRPRRSPQQPQSWPRQARTLTQPTTAPPSRSSRQRPTMPTSA